MNFLDEEFDRSLIAEQKVLEWARKRGYQVTNRGFELANENLAAMSRYVLTPTGCLEYSANYVDEDVQFPSNLNFEGFKELVIGQNPPLRPTGIFNEATLFYHGPNFPNRTHNGKSLECRKSNSDLLIYTLYDGNNLRYPHSELSLSAQFPLTEPVSKKYYHFARKGNNRLNRVSYGISRAVRRSLETEWHGKKFYEDNPVLPYSGIKFIDLPFAVYDDLIESNKLLDSLRK